MRSKIAKRYSQNLIANKILFLSIYILIKVRSSKDLFKQRPYNK